jgi:hypothetical protein
LAPDGEGQNESVIIAEDLENPEILAFILDAQSG